MKGDIDCELNMVLNVVYIIEPRLGNVGYSRYRVRVWKYFKWPEGNSH